jgi:hypothetical protein
MICLSFFKKKSKFLRCEMIKFRVNRLNDDNNSGLNFDFRKALMESSSYVKRTLFCDY